MGYPDKLVGDDIPLWAQIVSIVDVFDALVSPRVYKAPYEVDKACKMIVGGECGNFGPEIVRCFEIAKPDILKAM